MGDGPEIPAIRAFSACWTAQTGTHPPAQPPIHPRAKSRNPLSRPALRGGVARPGALATTGLYPAILSTGRFSGKNPQIMHRGILAIAGDDILSPQTEVAFSYPCGTARSMQRGASPLCAFIVEPDAGLSADFEAGYDV